MESDSVPLGAPFTFCAYGYPMLYPYIQLFGEADVQLPHTVSNIIEEGNKPFSIRRFGDKLNANQYSVGADRIYLLKLEDAIAHHARGDSYEVLQAMTMMLRSHEAVDFEKLSAIASQIGSKRQVGIIIDMCNLYFNSNLPKYENQTSNTDFICVPATFNASEPAPARGEQYADGMRALEKKWRCRCFLSDEELLKPKSFLELETPSFELLTARSRFYKSLGALVDFFEAKKIQYLISGGFAVTELVYPCTSPDIDIAIGRNMDKKMLSELGKFATKFGLALTSHGNEIALKHGSDKGVLFGFDISTWMYDKPVESFSFDRPHKMKHIYSDKALNFMSIDDLVVLRLGSNRCKSIEDARFASSQSMIRWDWVIETLARRGELEAASRDLYLIGGSELLSKIKSHSRIPLNPRKLNRPSSEENRKKNIH